MVSHLHVVKSWGLCGLLWASGGAVATAQAQTVDTSLASASSAVNQHQGSRMESINSQNRSALQPQPLIDLEAEQVSINHQSLSAATENVDHGGRDKEAPVGPQPVALTAIPAVRPTDLGPAIAVTALEHDLDTLGIPEKSRTLKKSSKDATPVLSSFFNAPRAVTAQPARTSSAIAQLGTSVVKPTLPSAPVTESPQDPELGVIEISEVRRDDELGVIQLRNPLQDPELGILELRQIAPPARRSPVVYFSSFITASSSDNIFLVEDPVQGRFGDNFIRPGISITAFPSLGPSTNLLLVARTTFLRYQEQSNSSYDELRFQAGVRHRFSERVYGQFTLSQQLLYDEGFTDQFFTNTGIELTVGRRDRLTPRLTFDSYYQGQVFFSDPERFSNVLNSVGGYLGYQITPQVDTGIGYRLTISDFTQQSRYETFQRVTGQLRYSISPGVRLSLFGGLSTGRSSESRITFDDTFFGISFDATVSIF